MSPQFFATNDNDKINLTEEELKTKAMYEKVRELDTLEDEKANQLLKDTINNGVGPYAALAAKIMCAHIDRNSGTWGIETSLGNILNNKEKYLSVAREKNHLIGYYLTTQAYLDLLKMLSSGMFMSSEESAISTVEATLNFYYIAKHFIDHDFSAYATLTMELKKDLNDALKAAEDFRSQNDTDEGKWVVSIAQDKIKKFKSPLHELHKRMESLDVPTEGPFAEDARKAAQVEIEKINALANVEPKNAMSN